MATQINYRGNYVLMTEEFYADLIANQVLKGFELYISTYEAPIEHFELHNSTKSGFLDLATTARIGLVGFDFYDNRLLSVDMGNQQSGSFRSCCLFYERVGINDLFPAFYIILNQSFPDDIRLQTISDAFNIFNIDLSNIDVRAKLLSYNHKSVSTHTHDMAETRISTSGVDSTEFFDLYLKNRDAPNETYQPPTSTTQTVIITDGFNFKKVENGRTIRDKSQLNMEMSTPSTKRTLMKNINEMYYVNDKSAIKLLGSNLTTKESKQGWVYFYKTFSNNEKKLCKCSIVDFITYLASPGE